MVLDASQKLVLGRGSMQSSASLTCPVWLQLYVMPATQLSHAVHAALLGHSCGRFPPLMPHHPVGTVDALTEAALWVCRQKMEGLPEALKMRCVRHSLPPDAGLQGWDLTQVTQDVAASTG